MSRLKTQTRRKRGPKPTFDPVLDSLLPGDVVIFGASRTERVVRACTYDQEDFLHTVTFAILRTSWTRRPSTTYCRTDLLSQKLIHGVVRRARDLDQPATEIEARVQAEIDADDRLMGKDRLIYAPQMVGLVR